MLAFEKIKQTERSPRRNAVWDCSDCRQPAHLTGWASTTWTSSAEASAQRPGRAQLAVISGSIWIERNFIYIPLKNVRVWAYLLTTNFIQPFNLILLYSFFWVIPRRLNFMCRHFGKFCLFHLHRWCKQDQVFMPPMKMEHAECSEM
jgi:hypothetical protein